MASSWRRRASKEKTSFEKLFDDKVDDIYGSMVKWAKGTKKQDGKTWIRPEQKMPFTKEQFSDWLLGQLRGQYEGVIQCAYCRKWLDITTITIDHKEPKSAPWYGSLGLENICCCCGPCNSAKGGCSADGWNKFIEWALLTLDTRDMNNMIGRLGNGSGYRPLQNRHRAVLAELQTLKGRK